MRILVAGARGEVGSSVSSALDGLGHVVTPASSAAPLDDRPDIVSLVSAAQLVRDGRIDAVVNCGGRGDRRATDRAGHDAVAHLPGACREQGIPAILVSTTRVLEGHESDSADDAEPAPRTPYAELNAAHEEAWLDAGGTSVLRITNYFCRPMTKHSPQSQLLPWSLVTEALTSGTITIRSGASLTKEFVSARDVARALETLMAATDPPQRCATVPGAPMSLRDLADAASAALVGTDHPAPRVTFGPDGPPGPGFAPGWLAEHGWSGQLTLGEVEQEIAGWVVGWGH